MGRESPVCQKQLPSSLSVTIFDEQNDLKLSHTEIRDVTALVLSHYSVKTDEVILHFVDTPTICKLHDQFFNDPTTTDCITLPIDGPNPISSPSLLGEVFICPKTGIDYDPEHPHDEVFLYIIHGLLHLIGYDDIQEEDEKIMRKEEVVCLKLLEQQKMVWANQPTVYT